MDMTVGAIDGEILDVTRRWAEDLRGMGFLRAAGELDQLAIELVAGPSTADPEDDCAQVA